MLKSQLKTTQQAKNIASQQQKLEQQKKSALQNKRDTILNNILNSNIVKPTNVEAQRILKIQDTFQKNIEILSILNSYFIELFRDVQGSIQKGAIREQDVSSMQPISLQLLQNQAEYERQHFQWEDEEAKSKLEAEKEREKHSDDDEEEEDPEEVARKLKEKEEERIRRQQKKVNTIHLLEQNLKNILRHFRQNEQDFEIIRNIKQPNNPLIEDLVAGVKSYGTIMLKKLSTAADEKHSLEKQLSDLDERIQRLEETKETLMNDLKKIKDQRKKFAAEKKEEFEKYQQGIQDLIKEKKEKKRLLLESTEQKLKQMQLDHEVKREKLKSKLNALKVELQKLKDSNAKVEDGLKGKKKSADENYKQTLKDYDEMMEKLMQEKDKIQQDLDEIVKELIDKKNHFKNVDEERERETKLEQEWKDKLEQKAVEERKKNNAILHLQLAFKEYVRKARRGKKRRMGKKK